jgi:Protein of unknown function (DUF2510)
MRRADAPRAGWYPDPESRTNLRWWDGLDWTDVRRAPPSGAEMIAAESAARFRAAANDFAPGATRAASTAAAAAAAGTATTQSQAVIKEVREATRSEIDRAAQMLSRQAAAARQNLTPLITQYTNKLFRWVKIAIVLGVLAFAAWVAFQIFAQASLFDWIGERIDNITDEDSSGLRASTRSLL